MRRSAAILTLALALATLATLASSHGPASAGPRRPLTAPAAALTVGIWNDPVSAVEAGVWAALQLVCILELIDDGFEHFKEDVRRAIEHPQQAPGVQPYGPSLPPELRPVRRSGSPQRTRQPDPIPESLPLRSIS